LTRVCDVRAKLNLVASGPMEVSMNEKPSATLPGVVEKVIKPPHPSEPERAQIAVEGADHLYKEIRIKNNLTDENGNEVALKEGAKVDVTVEADPKDTTVKKQDKTPSK